MKTVHLDPNARERAAEVSAEIDRLLGEGKRVAVTVAEDLEKLSPPKRRRKVSGSHASTS
jgi:hypothetical protein